MSGWTVTSSVRRCSQIIRLVDSLSVEIILKFPQLIIQIAFVSQKYLVDGY
jgi:hypothetical protein